MDKHTIRNAETGQIDIAASTNNYAKALSLWISQNEIDQEKIANAVNTVMDRFPEKLLMPMLISLSVQEISDDPNQYNQTEKQVKAYIKAQQETGKIKANKGRGAGVKRVAESISTPEPQATEPQIATG